MSTMETAATPDLDEAVRIEKPARIRPIDEDVPADDFVVTRVLDHQQLLSHVQAWDRLAEVSVSANAFQSPWFLLPALKHLTKNEGVEVLLVEASPRVNPQGPKVLCGMFPMVRRRSFYGIPCSCLELWQHPYNFLSTPLIRRDCIADVFNAVLDFLRTSSHGATLLHLPVVDAEGPWHQALVDLNHQQQRSVFVKDLFSRAMFRRATDAEAYLKNHVSRKKRHEAQRLERRLSESGQLASRFFQPDDDLDEWVNLFLKLESAGWKGAAGTAMANDPSHAKFFHEMVKAGAAANQLQFFRMDFNGQPIAMICNLLAGSGGFGFKIAYDESMAKYSPGVLLELEQIRRLHQTDIEWMDSCAAPDHPMINQYWTGRTLRQSLVLSNGSWLGNLVTSFLPLIRWCKRYAFRKSSAVRTDST